MAACAVSLPVEPRATRIRWADEEDSPAEPGVASSSQSCGMAAQKVRWADLSESPASSNRTLRVGSDASSSSAASTERPRTRTNWADMDDSPMESGVAEWMPIQQPSESPSCRGARDDLERVGECSTRASSVAGDESQEDRLKDVDGEDEAEAGEQLADESAAAAAAAATAADSAQQTSKQAGSWSAAASSSSSSQWWQQQQSGRGNNQYYGHNGWQQSTSKRGGGAWWKNSAASSAQSSWEGKHAGGASRYNSSNKASKGAGKGSSWAHHAGSAGYSKGSGKKYQCQFTIGIEEEPNFKVVKKVLGPHGQFVKKIAELTGAKLRLRGRGSGFVEGPAQKEADEPLMLCVSVLEAEGYSAVKRQVSELLEDVYKQYIAHCKAEGLRAPKLRVNMHEGAREGSY